MADTADVTEALDPATGPRTACAPRARRERAGVDLQEFFAAGCRCFRTAIGRNGVDERRLEVAGRPLLLRFAGPALAGIMTEALERPAAEPPREREDLTVLAWDTGSTGAPAPPAPPDLGSVPHRGASVALSDGDVVVVLSSTSGMLSAVSLRRRLALFWVRATEELPAHERAAPLRPLLHCWLQDRDVQLLHGAAVAESGASALIAGPGGCGKSVTALACLQAGMGFLGDDFCAVSAAPRPRVWSLYGTAKVDLEFAAAHPELAVAGATDPGNGKRILLVSRTHPHRIVTEATVRVILVPRLTGDRETRVTPMGPANALRAIAPSTLLLLPGAGARDLHTTARLLEQVPCYRLELGTRLAGIPPVIAGLLTRP